MNHAICACCLSSVAPARTHAHTYTHTIHTGHTHRTRTTHTRTNCAHRHDVVDVVNHDFICAREHQALWNEPPSSVGTQQSAYSTPLLEA